MKSKLRIGTDCSGIEAPIQALKQLNIPFEHVFASDIDKYCIQSIKSNYHPQILFGDPDGPYPDGDITNRNIKDVPDIDLYVCGFPCQPFSQAGKRGGFKDKRGNVFWSCLEVIKEKQPKYFILENVKGLLWHDKGDTWKLIWDALKEMDNYGYNVQWKVLNTRDYGIPQNRERVYIVGSKQKEFGWPEKKKMKCLKKYIDHSNTESRLEPTYIYNSKLLKIIPKNSIFVDFGFRNYKHPNADTYSPCIIANNQLWCVLYSRFSTLNELLMLQGFPKKFIQAVSKTRFKKQIGNSMSVNVVKEIIKNLL
jgi:DNA (cytosine-5)-methyltransferase 1